MLWNLKNRIAANEEKSRILREPVGIKRNRYLEKYSERDRS